MHLNSLRFWIQHHSSIDISSMSNNFYPLSISVMLVPNARKFHFRPNILADWPEIKSA